MVRAPPASVLIGPFIPPACRRSSGRPRRRKKMPCSRPAKRSVFSMDAPVVQPAGLALRLIGQAVGLESGPNERLADLPPWTQEKRMPSSGPARKSAGRSNREQPGQSSWHVCGSRTLTRIFWTRARRSLCCAGRNGWFRSADHGRFAAADRACLYPSSGGTVEIRSLWSARERFDSHRNVACFSSMFIEILTCTPAAASLLPHEPPLPRAR